MAVDSADDAVGLGDQLERLADIVRSVEADGVDVIDTETNPSRGSLYATLELQIDAGPRSPLPSIDGVHIDAEQIVDDLGDDLEAFEPEQENEPLDSEARPVDPSDEPSPATPAASDIGPGDLGDGEEDHEDEADDFDPDEAVERIDEEENRGVGEGYIGTESGLRDELEEFEEKSNGEVEDLEDNADAEPPEDTLAGEVLSTLREEGELAGPDIKMVTGAGSDMYTALGELQDDDLIEKRKDPDDGRRTLYRPADWLVDEGEDEDEDEEPVWSGRDPETIVADSSLPARVVLEDILNTVRDTDTVIDLAKELDVDIDNLEPVCWHLTLKQPNSLAIVDDVADRVEKIREVVAA